MVASFLNWFINFPAAVAVALLCASSAFMPAAAAQQEYRYRIRHPFFGTVGTYTNIVKQNGEDTEVDTELHAVASLIGIVFYRQDSHRVEHWHGDRLISFDGTTVENGEKILVHGEAKGKDGFVITSPFGTVVAPADVYPENPRKGMVWKSSSVMIMSTKDGELYPAKVSESMGKPDFWPPAAPMLRQFVIADGDRRKYVWADDRGVPVAFRTFEQGSAIDFVLVP
ncbi:MAG TPA: DUF6134 family protein [Alphaproteobacteria bacterium]|nr:DUF6134 family protein [Alphaproteobacteria bacterium]